MINLTDHVKGLVAQYGSYRNAGVATGIDHSYLYRLASGEKTDPTDEVLQIMGLERIVTYRKLARGGRRS